MTQGTGVPSTAIGDTFTLDSFAINTLAEEDGELKIIHIKHIADPQKRDALIGGIVKAAAQRALVS